MAKKKNNNFISYNSLLLFELFYKSDINDKKKNRVKPQLLLISSCSDIIQKYLSISVRSSVFSEK